MGGGKSRIRAYARVSGSTVYFDNGLVYDVGESWEELIKEANESNNYFNVMLLDVLQPGGLYAQRPDLKQNFYDENSLYIINQAVQAYKILEEITGGNEEFLFPVGKGESFIFVNSENYYPLDYLAQKNGNVLATTSQARMELNTVTIDKSGKKLVDLRDPKVYESICATGYREGWFSAGTVAGTILHEYGHSIERKLVGTPAYQKFMEDTNNGVSEMVSLYAASYKSKKVAAGENFAEAFAAYATGSSIPNKDAGNYYSAFKTLMRSIGIKEGKPYTPKYSSGASEVKSSTVNSSSSVSAEPKKHTVSSGRSTPVTTMVNKTPTASSVSSTRGNANSSLSAKSKTAKSFTNSNNRISGIIRGHTFSATITDGIRSRGYIERTIGSTKYRIDINTGEYTKV